ncbi:hypothetical protein GQ54DRAFT_43728 [Martensiomyces pterosporus]|nr:hypothetical protein GQ54DRAFT_43728 [Martensiomyces pterosporus]
MWVLSSIGTLVPALLREAERTCACPSRGSVGCMPTIQQNQTTHSIFQYAGLSFPKRTTWTWFPLPSPAQMLRPAANKKSTPPFFASRGISSQKMPLRDFLHWAKDSKAGGGKGNNQQTASLLTQHAKATL